MFSLVPRNYLANRKVKLNLEDKLGKDNGIGSESRLWFHFFLPFWLFFPVHSYLTVHAITTFPPKKNQRMVPTLANYGVFTNCFFYFKKVISFNFESHLEAEIKTNKHKK